MVAGARVPVAGGFLHGVKMQRTESDHSPGTIDRPPGLRCAPSGLLADSDSAVIARECGQSSHHSALGVYWIVRLRGR